MTTEERARALAERVDSIIVAALAQQDSYARRVILTMGHPGLSESDSEVVTRDVLAAIVEELGIMEENVIAKTPQEVAIRIRALATLLAASQEEVPRG